MTKQTAKKRILSALLTLCMAVAMFAGVSLAAPVTAHALDLDLDGLATIEDISFSAPEGYNPGDYVQAIPVTSHEDDLNIYTTGSTGSTVVYTGSATSPNTKFYADGDEYNDIPDSWYDIYPLNNGQKDSSLTITPIAGLTEGTHTGSIEFEADGSSLSNGTYTFTFTVTAATNIAPVITNGNPPNGTVGTAYSGHTFTATGTTPITWSVESGSLPTGLSLSGATISGTPTTAGTYNFTIKASNGTAPDATQAYTVTIAAAPAATPSITGQPQAATYGQNDTATALSVAASVTDGGTLSYQWYSNTADSTAAGTAIGTNSASYTPSTAAVGTLYYYVVVTNTKAGASPGTATTTSSTAAIEVTPPAETPNITGQPQGATYTVGDSATALSVTASVGTGTLSYQWYSNASDSTTGGTIIGGATNATYTPSTATAGTTYYYVFVKNTDGTKTATATSITAAVVVKVANAEAPAINTQPQGAKYGQGTTADALTVAASVTDSGTLSYQWYSNAADNNSSGTAISGATAASYTPPTATLGTVYYYVVVTNTNTNAVNTTSTTSSIAEIEVVTPTINHDPINPPDPQKPIDTSKEAELGFNGTFANFHGVRLNGTTLSTIQSGDGSFLYIQWPGKAAGVYCGEVHEGSVIITLYQEYIASLPAGTYTLEAVFNDGGVISSGELTFIIQAPTTNPSTPTPTPQDTTSTTTAGSPQTGDGSNIGLWVAMLTVAALGLIVALVVWWRRKPDDGQDEKAG